VNGSVGGATRAAARAGDRPSGRPALVLTHASWEGPGLVADALAGVPLDVRTVLNRSDPDLPAPADLAGLVVMGGPQGADDDAAHPGLAAERALLRRTVEAGVPVLAVCLGMQLLATALGAAVHRGHGTEIGFAPVDVLGPDPVLAPLGERPTVLHWHSDAVDLPTGAKLLASTPATPVQAFRAGSALGLQFHVEVDDALLGRWLATPAMTGALPADVVAGLSADAGRVLRALVPAARSGLASFAAAVRERR
jgi:GMP synthase (glutamine-hydrolysing)